MHRSKNLHVVAGAGLLLGCAGGALAHPVSGTYVDGPDCDNHGPQLIQEELGLAPAFPLDELISATSGFVGFSACPLTDNGTGSALVTITNLSGRSWTDLYYVADPKTTVTNVDGFATSAGGPGVTTQAFRIDMAGQNRSLVAESISNDGVFQPGEMWEILLQNYVNTDGIAPDQFGSLDFAGASAADFVSSGSIVSLIPSPGGAALAGVCGLGLLRRRRA